MRKKIHWFIVLLTSMMPFYAYAAKQSQSITPFAEFLYWRASETNSSWATTINFPTNTIDVVQSQPNFNSHAGVKVGLFYSPGDHFWNTKLYYTYYTTQTNSNIHLNLQLVSSLFFSGSYFISRDIFFGGNSSWDITMNMADLEISHAFHPTPTLSISPKLGIKGGTINQSININWNAFIYHASEELINNFSGIGPSFGITADWNFISDLSLVGDVSTALMYGKWKDRDTYQRPATLFTTQTTISAGANDSRLGTTMMDYYLGLQWRHHGKSDVTVRLGYEGQYWPNQLRLIAIQQLRTFGDLTFQGATCNVSINF